MTLLQSLEVLQGDLQMDKHIHSAPPATLGGGPKPLPPHAPENCPECATWVVKGWAGTPEQHRKARRMATIETIALSLVLGWVGMSLGLFVYLVLT